MYCQNVNSKVVGNASLKFFEKEAEVGRRSQLHSTFRYFILQLHNIFLRKVWSQGARIEEASLDACRLKLSISSEIPKAQRCFI